MRWIGRNLGAGAVQAIGGIVVLSAGAALAASLLSLPTTVAILVVVMLAGFALFTLGTVVRVRGLRTEPMSDVPSDGRSQRPGWQRLSDDLKQQRAVLRDHYRELEHIIGPPPAPVGPRSAADRQEVTDAGGHGMPRARRVVGQEFNHERIVLDGTVYVECTFADCTFVWDGLRPWEFMACRLAGTTRLEAPSGPVAGTIDLLNYFGFLREDFAQDWKHLPAEHFEPSAAEPDAVYRGRVVDADSGAPIVGVLVSADRELTRTAWTDDDGRWLISLPGGRVWPLVFSRQGYRPSFGNVGGGNDPVVVRLAPGDL